MFSFHDGKLEYKNTYSPPDCQYSLQLNIPPQGGLKRDSLIVKWRKRVGILMGKREE
jgi:hypothetical protein